MAKDIMPLFRGDCKYCVYVYRDPRPRQKNAPIYVGKGGNDGKRADSHWKGYNRHNLSFRRALDEIRTAGLDPIIEIVAWFDTENAAFEHEKYLIAQFGRRDTGKGPLHNHTDGGIAYPSHRASRPRNPRISKSSRRKPRERLKRLDGKTGFCRWRALVGVYQKEAAELLGISFFLVQAYESGRAVPDLSTRILMRLIADRKAVPEPWPLDKQK